MKLLFDQNLSHHLVAHVTGHFPDSRHVRELDLAHADDETVWRHAAAHEFTIVSKDSDFHQRSLTLGAPPKLIWLRVGNGPTTAIAALLQERRAEIQAFGQDPDAVFLVLS